MPSRAIPAGWDWPQQSDGPVAPQAGAPASSWSNAPAQPQAPTPAQFAPPAGAPVNVAPAAPASQQSPYAPGHSGVTAASAAPAYGSPAGYPQQGAPAQPMPSYGQASAYQAQPAPVAQPMQQAAAPQYGVNPQAAYASQPAQPSTDQLLQLAFSRLKSNATVAIVMSFVWFFTTPVILLLANAVRAQRLCTHAREIDAPSDVTRKVNIARGIAFGMLLLQVSLIILLIVSENMR